MRLALFLALSGIVSAQVPSDLVKPRVAGQALASQFGLWTEKADGPILGNGLVETAVLEDRGFTLPDGTSFLPLAAGTPLLISGDGNAETVVPAAVNCGVGGPGCSFTAVFGKQHAGHFTVSSATFGAQEAINAVAASGGGIVVLDADYRGAAAAVVPGLKLPSTVLLVDETRGNFAFYGLGNGGAPQLLASFSSALGSTLPTLGGGALTQLNGAQFVSARNFVATAGGVPLTAGVTVTVTPNWAALPAGVVAGDTLYLSGGSGSAEVVSLANVGAGCAAGGAGSVCFTPLNAHSGAWTLQSATAGVQEALNAAGAGGWVIDDQTVSNLRAPAVITATVRLSGFSNFDGGVGTRLVQLTPNTDTVQVGTATVSPSDVVIENLLAVGVKGDGTDSGVAIHCVNCAKPKLTYVTAKQAHDGLFLDSTYGHAFDATVTGSHFIGNYYGVHLVGGSANRATFVGNTVDGNSYGVFDDGGWVHTWVGNDIEANTVSGYWQQVSQPASYSGHNVVLHGNYFENNGANTAGRGDVTLGALVGGGAGNNGAGCLNCEVHDNIFNASPGGNVTALQLGAVDGTLQNNTYSGYGAGKLVTTVSGPPPNYTRVLALNDPTGRAGTLSRVDSNGTFTLGGPDQLQDQFGSPLTDTTIESPTGQVSIRGLPGGLKAGNGANLELDGNSSANRSNQIQFRNQHVPEFTVHNDPYGANAHDMCLLGDNANPSAEACLAYVNGKHWKYNAAGEPGTVALPADYQFTQQANGDQALVINRASDTAPSGFLLDLEDATLSTPLFRVDATGTVVAGKLNLPTTTPSFSGVNGTSYGPLAAGGMNTTGAALSLFGGEGTGSAAGGGINFQVAVTGASGTQVNPLATVGSVTASGVLAWGAGGITSNGNAVLTTASATLAGQTGSVLGQNYAAGACASSALTVTGAASGMVPEVAPESDLGQGFTWEAFVSAANTVLVRLCNTSGVAATAAGSIYDVRVIR